MKRVAWLTLLIAGLCVVAIPVGRLMAQEKAAEPAKADKPAETVKADKAAPAPAEAGAPEEPQKESKGESMNLKNVIMRAGWFGVVIWIMLIAASIVSVALTVDSFMNIRESKIAPANVVESVRSAIEQGDVIKAIQHCEESPTPLAKILKAGFLNIQEGFEVVQDSVGVAADIESEKLLARVTYLSVISNTTPMLGLIGTVQGMIYAFFTLATQESGAAQQAMLALNISHGLWATAVGLGTSVPAAIFFYYFKNRAMRIILGMEALTLDVTKSLRNVEVVEE
jgi:biopolymer transport protein ExbB